MVVPQLHCSPADHSWQKYLKTIQQKDVPQNDCKSAVSLRLLLKNMHLKSSRYKPVRVWFYSLD